MDEVDHERGAVVVVRLDLWTGVNVSTDEERALDGYFSEWLLSSPDIR